MKSLFGTAVTVLRDVVALTSVPVASTPLKPAEGRGVLDAVVVVPTTSACVSPDGVVTDVVPSSAPHAGAVVETPSAAVVDDTTVVTVEPGVRITSDVGTVCVDSVLTVVDIALLCPTPRPVCRLVDAVIDVPDAEIRLFALGVRAADDALTVDPTPIACAPPDGVVGDVVLAIVPAVDVVAVVPSAVAGIDRAVVALADGADVVAPLGFCVLEADCTVVDPGVAVLEPADCVREP